MIYPNPSTNGSVVTIEIPTAQKNTKTEVYIYNALGEIVINEQINSSSIELKTLTSGIYFCKKYSWSELSETFNHSININYNYTDIYDWACNSIH